MNLSLLFQDRKAELGLNEETFDEMKLALATCRSRDWLNFIQMAMSLSILFPERKAELKYDGADIDWMKDELAWWRGWGSWPHFSETASCLSLLFPDRKAELNLNDAAFEGMKKELEGSRGTDWWGFSHMAMNLAVLASERAEIVNGRIVIQPKKPKLTGEPKPLPERLKI